MQAGLQHLALAALIGALLQDIESIDIEELQPARPVVVAHAINVLAAEGREAGPEGRESLVWQGEEGGVLHVQLAELR